MRGCVHEFVNVLLRVFPVVRRAAHQASFEGNKSRLELPKRVERWESHEKKRHLSASPPGVYYCIKSLDLHSLDCFCL